MKYIAGKQYVDNVPARRKPNFYSSVKICVEVEGSLVIYCSP